MLSPPAGVVCQKPISVRPYLGVVSAEDGEASGRGGKEMGSRVRVMFLASSGI